MLKLRREVESNEKNNYEAVMNTKDSVIR